MRCIISERCHSSQGNIVTDTLDPLPLAGLPQNVRDALAAGTPFSHRLGQPNEYAKLVESIVRNAYLNGETIRLDGALRMAPR